LCRRRLIACFVVHDAPVLYFGISVFIAHKGE
jgi:hypothetical protein